MKKIYILPKSVEIDLLQKDGILDITSASNEVGDGGDFVKGQIFVVDEEEQRTAYTNYNIWDEEW